MGSVYEGTTNIEKARSVALIATVAIVGMAVAKILVGYYFGSLAIVADGFHSLGDFLVALLVLVALNFLVKRPSERFPYGYYKIEDFIVFVLSILFGFFAISIGYEAVLHLASGEYSSIDPLASLVAFISGILSFLLAVYMEKTAKKSNTKSLLFNAKELKLDTISSTLVGLSVIMSNVTPLPMDEIASLIIVIFLIRIAVESMRESFLALVDAWHEPELLGRLRRIILSFDDVVSVRRLRLRKAGPIILGDATIIVRPNMDLEEAHKLTREIQEKIKEEIPEISEVILYLEPQRVKDIIIAVPSDEKGEKISDHFGRAPCLVVVKADLDEKNYVRIEVMPNPFIGAKDKIGINLAKLLARHGIDAVIVRNIGENAFYILRGFGIKIFKSRTDTVDSTIQSFLNGELEELRRPVKG